MGKFDSYAQQAAGLQAPPPKEVKASTAVNPAISAAQEAKNSYSTKYNTYVGSGTTNYRTSRSFYDEALRNSQTATTAQDKKYWLDAANKAKNVYNYDNRTAYNDIYTQLGNLQATEKDLKRNQANANRAAFVSMAQTANNADAQITYNDISRQLEENQAAQARLTSLLEELDSEIESTNMTEDVQAAIQRLTDNKYAGQNLIWTQGAQQKKQDQQIVDDFYASIGMNSKYFNKMDSARGTVKAGLNTIGSGYTNAAAFLSRAADYGTGIQNVEGWENAGWATDDVSAANMNIAQYEKNRAEYTKKWEETGGNNSIFDYAADKLEVLSDDLAGNAARELQQSKENLGKFGDFMVDAGHAIMTVGADMAVAPLTGGSSLVPMFVRVFGESAGEARRSGASFSQQGGYALAKASIETVSEKMFGAFDKIGYGKGFLPVGGIEDAITNMAKSDVGKYLVKGLYQSAEEGAEEVFADLAEPFAQWIIDEQSRGHYFSEIEVSELFRDYLLGATLGGLGSIAGSPSTIETIKQGDRVALASASRAVARGEELTAEQKMRLERGNEHGGLTLKDAADLRRGMTKAEARSQKAELKEQRAENRQLRKDQKAEALRANFEARANESAQAEEEEREPGRHEAESNPDAPIAQMFDEIAGETSGNGRHSPQHEERLGPKFQPQEEQESSEYRGRHEGEERIGEENPHTGEHEAEQKEEPAPGLRYEDTSAGRAEAKEFRKSEEKAAQEAVTVNQEAIDNAGQNMQNEVRTGLRNRTNSVRKAIKAGQTLAADQKLTPAEAREAVSKGWLTDEQAKTATMSAAEAKAQGLKAGRETEDARVSANMKVLKLRQMVARGQELSASDKLTRAEYTVAIESGLINPKEAKTFRQTKAEAKQIQAEAQLAKASETEAQTKTVEEAGKKPTSTKRDRKAEHGNDLMNRATERGYNYIREGEEVSKKQMPPERPPEPPQGPGENGGTDIAPEGAETVKPSRKDARGMTADEMRSEIENDTFSDDDFLQVLDSTKARAEFAKAIGVNKSDENTVKAAWLLWRQGKNELTKREQAEAKENELTMLHSRGGISDSTYAKQMVANGFWSKAQADDFLKSRNTEKPRTAPNPQKPKGDTGKETKEDLDFLYRAGGISREEYAQRMVANKYWSEERGKDFLRAKKAEDDKRSFGRKIEPKKATEREQLDELYRQGYITSGEYYDRLANLGYMTKDEAKQAKIQAKASEAKQQQEEANRERIESLALTPQEIYERGKKVVKGKIDSILESMDRGGTNVLTLENRPGTRDEEIAKNYARKLGVSEARIREIPRKQLEQMRDATDENPLYFIGFRKEYGKDAGLLDVWRYNGETLTRIFLDDDNNIVSTINLGPSQFEVAARYINGFDLGGYGTDAKVGQDFFGVAGANPANNSTDAGQSGTIATSKGGDFDVIRVQSGGVTGVVETEENVSEEIGDATEQNAGEIVNAKLTKDGAEEVSPEKYGRKTQKLVSRIINAGVSSVHLYDYAKYLGNFAKGFSLYYLPKLGIWASINSKYRTETDEWGRKPDGLGQTLVHETTHNKLKLKGQDVDRRAVCEAALRKAGCSEDEIEVIRDRLIFYFGPKFLSSTMSKESFKQTWQKDLDESKRLAVIERLPNKYKRDFYNYSYEELLSDMVAKREGVAFGDYYNEACENARAQLVFLEIFEQNFFDGIDEEIAGADSESFTFKVVPPVIENLEEPSAIKRDIKSKVKEQTYTKDAGKNMEAGQAFQWGKYDSATMDEVSRVADYRINKAGKDAERSRLLDSDNWDRTDYAEAQKLIIDFSMKLNKKMVNGQIKTDTEYQTERYYIDELMEKYRQMKSEMGQKLQQKYKVSIADEIRMRAAHRFLNYSPHGDGRVFQGNRYSGIYRTIDNLLKAADKAVASNDVNNMIKVVEDASYIRGNQAMFGKLGVAGEHAGLEFLRDNGATAEDLSNLLYGDINRMIDDFDTVRPLNMVNNFRTLNMLSALRTANNNLLNNAAGMRIGALAQNIGYLAAKQFEAATGKKVAIKDSSLTRLKNGTVKAEAVAFVNAALMSYYGINVENGRLELDNIAKFNPNGNFFERLGSRYSFLVSTFVMNPDQMGKARIDKGLQDGIEQAFQGVTMTPEMKANKAELEGYKEYEKNRRLVQADNSTVRLVQHFKEYLNRAKIGNQDIGYLKLGDFLMPFAKVPVNIAQQRIAATPYGAMYHLLSAAKGYHEATEMHKAVLNGVEGAKEMSAKDMAKYSMNVGRAATTGGMLAIGAIAAMTGALKDFGNDDDDDDEAKIWRNRGFDGLTLNISAMLEMRDEWKQDDWVVGAGFLEIFAAPLAIGALAWDAHAEGMSVPEATWYATKRSFTDVLDAIADIPGMQAASQMYEAYTYAPAGEDNLSKAWTAVRQYLANAASGYVMPNALTQTATGLDNVMRNPYTADNDWQQSWQIFANKIPFLRNTLPAKLDMWGNPKKYAENKFLAFMNKAVLPGAIHQVKTDKYEDEIIRLSRAGYKNMLPVTSPPNKIEVGENSYQLNKDQKLAYEAAYKEWYREYCDSFMDSELYQSLDDGQRVGVLKQLKLDAGRKTKQEFLDATNAPDSITMDKWETELEFEDQLDFLSAKQIAAGLWDNDENMVANSAKMDEFIKTRYGDYSEDVKNLLNNSYSHLDDLYDASRVGINSERWQTAYNIYKKWTDSKAKANISNEAEMWSQIEKAIHASDAEMRFIEQHMQLHFQGTPDTDQYYEYLNDAGLTRSEASATLKAVSNLQPQAGYSSVQQTQKYMAICDTVPASKQWAAFWSIVPSNASKSKIEKMRQAQESGVDLKTALRNAEMSEIKGRELQANGKYRYWTISK